MCVLISDKFDQLVKKLEAEELQRKVIEGTTSCVMKKKILPIFVLLHYCNVVAWIYVSFQSLYNFVEIFILLSWIIRLCNMFQKWY